MQQPADSPKKVAGLHEVGRVVSHRYTFTEENIRAYAAMAGDTNPLHHDGELAASSRFGSLIASAAHTTGVLISVVADKFAANGEAVGLGFDLTLRRAVKAGTETDLIWAIAEKKWSEKLNGTVVTLTGEIRDVANSLTLLNATGSLLLLTHKSASPDDAG
ncbi:MAG: MaoC family dehydratase [Alphaproteobacteria bacterium]|nr:MaoC family dehydratase [Alphaproteobacteria bacterium]